MAYHQGKTCYHAGSGSSHAVGHVGTWVWRGLIDLANWEKPVRRESQLAPIHQQDHLEASRGSHRTQSRLGPRLKSRGGEGKHPDFLSLLLPGQCQFYEWFFRPTPAATNSFLIKQTKWVWEKRIEFEVEVEGSKGGWEERDQLTIKIQEPKDLEKGTWTD